MNMQHGTFDGFGKLLYLQNGTPEKSHPALTDRRTSGPLFGFRAEGEEQPLSSHSVHPPTHQPASAGPTGRPLHVLTCSGGRGVGPLQTFRENTLSCLVEEGVRDVREVCVGRGCRSTAALCVQAAQMEVMEWYRVPAKARPSASGTKKNVSAVTQLIPITAAERGGGQERGPDAASKV